MKKIGLIGGMSWESTTLYYQWINQEVQQRLGGLHSAKILINSVDFAEIARMQRDNEWEAAARYFIPAYLWREIAHEWPLMFRRGLYY